MKTKDLFVPLTPRPAPAPRWTQYSATIDTAIRLTWGDRLRALIGGAVVVRCWVAMEKKPGRIDCESRLYTDPMIRSNVIRGPWPARESLQS